jgi:hypothetical protein
MNYDQALATVKKNPWWAVGGVAAAGALLWYFSREGSAGAAASGAPAWLPRNLPAPANYPDFMTVQVATPNTAWNLDKNVAQTFPAGSGITASPTENAKLKAAGVSGGIFYANDGTGKTARFYSAIPI